MTWEEKYKENQMLVKLYIDFLMSERIAPESHIKLMAEVVRLDNQNKFIDLLPYGMMKKDSNDTFKTKESILNGYKPTI